MHQSDYIKTASKNRLFTQSWTVDHPIANVYIVHGFGEHSGRYEAEAEPLNKAKLNVFTFDLKGHGRSEGNMGYISRFTEYKKDLSEYLESIWNPDTPNFIYGHSMGALICLDWLINDRPNMPNFRGFISTSAALMVSKDIAPLLQKLSGIVGEILPKLRTIKVDPNVISRIPKVVEKYKSDPLILSKGIHARTASEMISTQNKLWSIYEKFNHPILIMYGSDDTLIEPEGSIHLHANVSSQDKELVKWDGSYHEITRDLDGFKVMEKMIDWMKLRI